MKTFLLSAVVAMAFVYQPCARAQATAVGPGAVKLGKLSPEGIKSPEYQITGGPQKRSKVGTWLEVEVEFETKMDDIAELKFDYTLQIEGKLLTGTVSHINIPRGKDHFSVVYVSPRSLEKLLGNKPMTSAAIQNAWVLVSSPDGVKLDEASMKPGVTYDKIPNLPRQAGMVLSKPETPFAPLFYDRYEAVKTTR